MWPRSPTRGVEGVALWLVAVVSVYLVKVGAGWGGTSEAVAGRLYIHEQ
jgi:hypothetical protein